MFGVVKRVRRDKTQFARQYLTFIEQVKQNLYCWLFSATTKSERELAAIPEGLLVLISYMGMCRTLGYGFQTVLV